MRNSGKTQWSQLVPFTQTVKRLIIVNAFIWLVLQVIVEQMLLPQLELNRYFGLVPGLVTQNFYIWQIFTYMFLHSLDPTHVIFNMLMLWWLGGELENRWGKKFFTFYYLASGTIAAVIYVVFTYSLWILGGRSEGLLTPVVGASGAIFALLLAYGILFGERVVYFMFVFPMKAKYFVMLLGVIELVLTINSGGIGKIANSVHLAGLLSGWILLVLSARWSQRKKAKSAGPKLRLVVDNKKPNEDNGPRYWN